MSRVMTDLLRWLTLDTHNIDKHMLLTAKAHLLAEVDCQLLQANKFPQIIPYRSEITYAAVCKRLTTDTVRGPHWHHMLMTPTDSGRGNKYAKTEGEASGVPGGVPQQSRRSSTCSTSSPMNQDPRDTSSLAYLCRTCLKCLHQFMVNDRYLLCIKE